MHDQRPWCRLVVPWGLVLLAVAGVVQADVDPTTCARAESRDVRRVVHEFLLPQAAKQKDFTLSRSCPLHPDRNIYEVQEQKRKAWWREEWKCSVCGHVALTAAGLDHHMDDSHSDLLVQRPDSLCQADFYDVLHAGYFTEHVTTARGDVKGAHRCRAAEAAKLAQDCRTLARQCFPPEASKGARKLHEYMTSSYCGAHTCHMPTHERLLHRITRAHKVVHSGFRWIGGLGLVIIAVGYGAFWYVWKNYIGYHTKQDVRRIRPPSRQPWLSQLQASLFRKRKRKKQF